MKKHLEAFHVEVFTKLQKLDQEVEDRSRKDTQTHQMAITQYGVLSNPSFIYKPINNVQLSFQDLLISSIKQIVIHQRPMKYLTDKATRAVHEPLLNAIPYVPFSINPPNVIRFMEHMVEAMKKEILHLTKGNVISLKLDGASCGDRSFLGINIQLRKKDNIHDFRTYTLGCIELFKSSTSQNLKNEVVNTLNKFGIDLKSVLTITTDNGANYAKTSKIINADIDSAENSEDKNEDKKEDEDDFDFSFDLDEIEVEEINDSDFEMREILKELTEEGYGTESVIGKKILFI